MDLPGEHLLFSRATKQSSGDELRGAEPRA
jgi:hypothetical protein